MCIPVFNVELDQSFNGQAEKAIKEGAEQGLWVILQNCQVLKKLIISQHDCNDISTLCLGLERNIKKPRPLGTLLDAYLGGDGGRAPGQGKIVSVNVNCVSTEHGTDLLCRCTCCVLRCAQHIVFRGSARPVSPVAAGN